MIKFFEFGQNFRGAFDVVTMVSGTEQLTRTQPKRPDFDNELNIVKSLAKQWDNIFYRNEESGWVCPYNFIKSMLTNSQKIYSK